MLRKISQRLERLAPMMAGAMLCLVGQANLSHAYEFPYYWTGNGTNANWSTNENWSSSPDGQSTPEIIFNGSSTQLTNTLDSAFSTATDNDFTSIVQESANGDVSIDVAMSGMNIGKHADQANAGIFLPATGTTNLTLSGNPIQLNANAPSSPNAYLSVASGRTLTSTGGFVTADGGGAVIKNGAGKVVLGGSTDNYFLTLDITEGTVDLDKASLETVHAVGSISGIAVGATVKQTGTGTLQVYEGGTVTMDGGTYDLNGLDFGSSAVRGARFAGYGKLVNSTSTAVKVYSNRTTSSGGQFEIVANAGSIEIDSASSDADNAPNGPELAVEDPHTPGIQGDPRQDPFYHEGFWNWSGPGTPRSGTFLILTGTGTVKLTGTETSSSKVAVMSGTLELGHDQYDDAGVMKNSMAVGKIQFLATGAIMKQTGTSVKQVSPGGNVHMNGGTYDLNGIDFGDATLTGTVLQNSNIGNAAFAFDTMSGPLASPVNYSCDAWTKSVITNSSSTQVVVNARRTELYGNMEVNTVGDIDWRGAIGAGSAYEPGGGVHYRDVGSLIKSGDGRLFVKGPTVYKGGTIVTGGTLRLADEVLDGAANDDNDTYLSTGYYGTDNSMTGKCAQTAVLNVAFNALATTDIQAGKLILEYDQAADAGAYVSNVKNILTASYNSDWAPGRISSSTAAADPLGRHALGWIQDSVNSLVEVAFTLYGDANFDEVVTNADLALMAPHWLGDGVWGEGDYDYDGFVGLSDLQLMADNWQAPAGSSQTFAEACQQAGITPIPEPGTLSLLIGAALGLSLCVVRNRIAFTVWLPTMGVATGGWASRTHRKWR